MSQLLTDMGYSRQVNQKMLQVGEPSHDHNEQFGIINDLTKQYLEESVPVISVDTKKKENIGNFKNNGAEYYFCGQSYLSREYRNFTVCIG